MTTTPRLAAAALVLLAAASPAAAAPPTRAVSLEVGAASPGRATAALAASGWLEGEVEATARLAWWSAPRTAGRAADGAAEGWAALAGLRWAPDLGRLRPLLGLEGGAAWDGRARAAGALRAGGEWLWRRDWSASAGAGLALRAGRGAALEGWLGLACYF